MSEEVKQRCAYLEDEFTDILETCQKKLKVKILSDQISSLKSQQLLIMCFLILSRIFHKICSLLNRLKCLFSDCIKSHIFAICRTSCLGISTFHFFHIVYKNRGVLIYEIPSLVVLHYGFEVLLQEDVLILLTRETFVQDKSVQETDMKKRILN